MFKKNVLFFFIVTAYPAHSRLDSGNIVLRHSVPHFPSNSGIACWVAGLNAALSLDTSAKKMKILIISFLRVRIESRTYGDSFALCPCATTDRQFFTCLYCVLSGVNQRWYQSEEMKILINKNSFSRFLEPTTAALQLHLYP